MTSCSWIIHSIYIATISVLMYKVYHLHPNIIGNEQSQSEIFNAHHKQGSSTDRYHLTSSEEYIVSVRNEGSSVWCWGSNHTNRMCRFKNLCYVPKKQNFVFFHGMNSVLVGVPINRFNPSLLDLSSVENHNGQYFNFVDVPSSSSEKLLTDVQIVPKTSLIFSRFHTENIMHVMHDDLLPLYTTLCMINGGLPCTSSRFDIQLMFADNCEDGEFNDLYLKFTNNIPISRRKLHNISSLGMDTSVCFSNVYVGISKDSTWYQYGFYSSQGPLSHTTVTVQDIKHFTHYFTSRLLTTGVSSLLPPKDLVVLVSRKETRLIVNEMDLCLTLAKHLGMKVISISMETHSITEMVSLLSEAILMIGMHGSLMIFSMFLPPGAVILEMFPYGVNPEHYTPYKTLANIHGMNLFYRSWRNRDISKTIMYPDRPPRLGGIRHLSIEDQILIQNSEEVSPHLCCSDPAWLFRIHQDTVVNLVEILQLLNSGLEDRQKYITNSRNKDINQHKDNMDSKDLMYPSEIQNLHCICSCKEHNNTSEHCIPKVHCQWNPPWNTKYCEETSLITYEVWVQKAGEEDYISYIILGTEISLTEDFVQDNQYYMWIRAIVNKAKGPFTFRTCHTT